MYFLPLLPLHVSASCSFCNANGITKAAASVEKNCIEWKQPPEDGCMKSKHVVEEEEENT
jgi:hypothetical protein